MTFETWWKYQDAYKNQKLCNTFFYLIHFIASSLSRTICVGFSVQWMTYAIGCFRNNTKTHAINHCTLLRTLLLCRNTCNHSVCACTNDAQYYPFVCIFQLESTDSQLKRVLCKDFKRLYYDKWISYFIPFYFVLSFVVLSWHCLDSTAQYVYKKNPPVSS